MICWVANRQRWGTPSTNTFFILEFPWRWSLTILPQPTDVLASMLQSRNQNNNIMWVLNAILNLLLNSTNCILWSHVPVLHHSAVPLSVHTTNHKTWREILWLDLMHRGNLVVIQVYISVRRSRSWSLIPGIYFKNLGLRVSAKLNFQNGYNN